MIYDETTSGGILGDGLVLPIVRLPVPTAFVPGEAVYSVVKARRGVLKRLIIKTVRTVTNRRTFGATNVVYVDTFNGLWNERDLVRPDQAHALVAAYAQRLYDDAKALR